MLESPICGGDKALGGVGFLVVGLAVEMKYCLVLAGSLSLSGEKVVVVVVVVGLSGSLMSVIVFEPKEVSIVFDLFTQT